MNTEVLPDGTFILDEPVQLPDTLDALIVGGGPAGTAAAFRAKELGLSALVIDYDDLMKRIRDYAKDKLILPDFGGGDQMQFPKGDRLLSALAFDPIDKDLMCDTWKGFYRTFNVPAKIGVELTGFEHQPNGTIRVQTWNHKTRSEEFYTTRHLVFAIGRGVPRRFDIPGNTDGIAYRLDKATNYVGRPVCVIGGGTSAAEAVISISNAKISSNDSCPVYWSYRGDKMPRVSKALSDVFFDAYVGNGNVRYYPRSEPVAIVQGPDREDYLSIRVDRRMIEGRSIETTHLEFPKTNCIACIGEDIPESYLNSMGVYMATGGPKNKKRMVVTPLLETQENNVYLVGDILSQVYFETPSHQQAQKELKEIRHRGNIKSALRDGVFIAEVIKQKISGSDRIRVELNFQSTPKVTDTEEEDTRTGTSIVSANTPQYYNAETPVEKELNDLTPRLVRITPGEVEEDEFMLIPGGRTTLGQSAGDIHLPVDSTSALIHASIDDQGGNWILNDEGSPSGVFLRLIPGVLLPIKPNTLLQLGRQFLMFRENQGTFSMDHYDRTGALKQKHPLAEGTIVMGRDAPDIVLDANDKILSRRHLIVSLKDGALSVKDPGSLNKTYLRVKEPTPLQPDDVFRIGPHLFKLSVGGELPKDNTVFQIPSAPSGKSAAPASPKATPSQAPVATPQPVASPNKSDTMPPSAPPAVTTEPSLQFAGHPGTFTAQSSDSILEVARSNDIPIKYECQSGSCGYDPIRIVSGSEYLNEVDDEGEEWTLEEICNLEPGNEKGKCRLACMTKVTGPVVVEIISK